MDKKLEKLHVDPKTLKLLKSLNLDHMYYTPNAPFNEYDFLKRISKIKNKGNK